MNPSFRVTIRLFDGRPDQTGNQIFPDVEKSFVLCTDKKVVFVHGRSFPVRDAFAYGSIILFFSQKCKYYFFKDRKSELDSEFRTVIKMEFP